jgi:single-strand DNA-binding protein
MSNGEKRSETEWFNVVAWSSLAEICNQFLVKGNQVYIEGRLQTRHWEDDNGIHHSSVEIVANEMIMLNHSKTSGNNPDKEDSGDNEFPF